MSTAQIKEQKDVQEVQAFAVPATYAQPHAIVVEGVAAQPETNIGVCRRCRQPFVRRPGVNDGQAQYYRCENCEQFRLMDLIEGSCTIS